MIGNEEKDRDPRPKAVLVAVKFPEVSEAELSASLDELERLVSTLGYRAIARVTQARARLAPAAVLGEGKLKELAELTGGEGEVGSRAPKPRDKARLRREERAADGADGGEDGDDAAEDGDDEADGADGAATEKKVALVAVDHDLSPSQGRNLERAAGVAVLDRTGVIVEIFHRHAKSREARLQVEIARLKYTAPRMRESGHAKERQQGRGAGEAALELDRRKIRTRIAELTEELAAVQREQGNRRAHRRDARRIALVGYTNAGKSSLMRALTGSDVYVEDKLFATLDTTVRALQPEATPRILVSDTVGFIRKLPHDLVASFKATLDEALEASHLLHVVDAADPDWKAQHAVTRDVLAEIEADRVPTTLVFNKIDKLSEERRAELAAEFPHAWMVSALDPSDVASVRERIVSIFEKDYVEAELEVPWTRQKLVAEIRAEGRVLEERFEEDGVRVRFKAPAAIVERVRSELGGPAPASGDEDA